MDSEKKDKIKKACIVFVKALIPPTVALISSVLTILAGGDVGSSTVVGSVLGLASGAFARV